MANCIIPGCKNIAQNNFGVRLRRPDTTAIWAPNTDAYLCDHHATMGVLVEVTLHATNSSSVETRVTGVDPNTANRVTPIR